MVNRGFFCFQIYWLTRSMEVMKLSISKIMPARPKKRRVMVYRPTTISRHMLWSQGAGGHSPLFGSRGKRWVQHFELQPLDCSGKVKTLTQQCITGVTKVTTNSQQDP